jgi:hypothetical protein
MSRRTESFIENRGDFERVVDSAPAEGDGHPKTTVSARVTFTLPWTMNKNRVTIRSKPQLAESDDGPCIERAFERACKELEGRLKKMERARV